MSDDYLWDGSGAPDADTERVVRLLGRLRTPLPPVPDLDHAGSRSAADDPGSPKGLPDDLNVVGRPFRVARSYAGVRFLAPALAAAAAIVLMVATTWRTATTARSWEVARMAGQPRVDAAPLADTGRIAVGETLVTDAASRARLHVSTIGQVVVDNDTRVRLVETRRAHHELALERGTLHAFITAPPGQFVVNTPSSTATDLGCVYTLHVDEDGTGLLSVTAGWVAFEFKGRESFVPAGASSRTDPANGPGTPRYDDADRAFRDALDRVDDGEHAKGAGDALSYVLAHARPKDAMTLWHLLARVSTDERASVADALARLAPMPSGVTRDAVMRLDRAALDLWWDSLGLREANWWRKWKGAYPAAAAQQPACPITPTVRAQPPNDPAADPFPTGPWHVNVDRTLWMMNWSFPDWREGLNHKVMWIRPAGSELVVTGTRLDGPSEPLAAKITCCYPTGFQVGQVTFPSAGCWKINVKAGAHDLEFVTNVRPAPK